MTTDAQQPPRSPTGPGVELIPTMFRVLVRAQLRTGRLIGLGLLGAVGVVIGFLIDTDDPSAAAEFVSGYGLGVVAPIGALLIASSTLGDQVEDRTLVYFLLRPQARWTVALAAYLSAVAVIMPLVGVPLVIAAAATGQGSVVTGTLASVPLAVVAYAGIFLWLGLRVRRSLVWGLAYIMIWEGFVAVAGSGLARLAIRSWTRSVLAEFSGVDLTLADRTPSLAVVVCLGVGLAAVALTARLLDTREIE